MCISTERCWLDADICAFLISAQTASLSSLCKKVNISHFFGTPFKPHRTPKLLEGLHASAKTRGVPGRRGQYKASRLCCVRHTAAFHLLLPSAFLASSCCPSAAEANLSSRSFSPTGRRLPKALLLTSWCDVAMQAMHSAFVIGDLPDFNQVYLITTC